MTVEERLAEWLQQTTPEPPHRLEIEDVADRLDEPNRRRWTPLLAAASVLVLAAVAVFVATRLDDPKQAPAVSAAPWTATPLGTSALGAGPVLFGDGSTLYALRRLPGGHARIERLDPRDGHVLKARVVDGPGAVRPMIAQGCVVVVSMRPDHTLRTRLYEQTSLKLASRLPAVPADVSAFALDGQSAYYASRHRVIVQSVISGEITHRFDIPGSGEIRALGARNDNVYVATTDTVYALDGSSGETVAAPTPTHGEVSAVVPTAGGLWTIVNGSTVEFDGRAVIAGTDTAPATLTISAGAAWVGALDKVACADPDTGRVRAEATLSGTPLALVTGMVPAGRQVFATGRSGTPPRDYVLALHPPAACR